ncbi:MULTISPECIES: SDR family NAD(P)-dependent oxidoreductase [unclassified Sphingobium]|uniref:SDR family NAD(P)-dependent oxidoreductase n=1 Tax=unclassified Sphingobium TaxID=2611147 RepID=UPI00222446D9|nr:MULTISPECIES: SDR family oxidoreductase [unclassified Sphingobium]MCW2381348.1 NAD(P)-dependent dehydrogenase (short-subunit alcohol dehydrogenase family) [Sphingobium sp. B2D3B]MCW2398545.1 NAD(P)-dependent dehydrogenase (short-subunit alcohol dehydrogenase family) [Sphingobium sp. B2D3C]
MRFQDKVVLVIGGNSGIGRAAAQGFAAEGAHVFLTGRSQATIDETVAAIPGAQGFQADIAQIGSNDAVLDAIRAAHGRIDILFVNAGIGAFAPVEEVTPAQWDEVHNVNLRGCFFAVQKALPLMGQTPGGAIVITGSIGSVAAVPGNTMYAAAKAGLRAVARTLAAELIGRGIRVNMVSPGPTETPIINRSGLPPEAVAGMRAMMTDAIPMKRMGTPEEIARPVLFLASDEASFITGIDLYVDGGCVEL